MKVLVACEKSQKVCIAFRKNGHEAYSCDLEECTGGCPEWHIQCDVREILYDNWTMMIAHPECKRLANSGVRWLHHPPPGKTFDEIWLELYEAVKFYKILRDAPIEKKAIENPIMHKYARAMIGGIQRQVVQPWWFGDPAFKATGLELYSLPKLVPTNKLIPPDKNTEEFKEWSFIHRMPPGPKRSELRSITFSGLAAAMANQWGLKEKTNEM